MLSPPSPTYDLSSASSTNSSQKNMQTPHAAGQSVQYLVILTWIKTKGFKVSLDPLPAIDPVTAIIEGTT